jgi:hypothetical protein
MHLVATGLLNKQIAAEIGLSEVTVKVHRHNLMQKLRARSLPDLVRMADSLDWHEQPRRALHRSCFTTRPEQFGLARLP